jgi:hypothetical protein
MVLPAIGTEPPSPHPHTIPHEDASGRLWFIERDISTHGHGHDFPIYDFAICGFLFALGWELWLSGKCTIERWSGIRRLLGDARGACRIQEEGAQNMGGVQT